MSLLYRTFRDKSRRSLVYHQFRKKLHITNTKCCISSLRKRCNLRLMIYACGDDIHAKAWWYAIAFAMDKQKKELLLDKSSFFVGAADESTLAVPSRQIRLDGLDSRHLTEWERRIWQCRFKCFGDTFFAAQRSSSHYHPQKENGHPLGCPFSFLERLTRLELATSTLARWRSTRWATAAYLCNEGYYNKHLPVCQ